MPFPQPQCGRLLPVGPRRTLVLSDNSILVPSNIIFPLNLLRLFVFPQTREARMPKVFDLRFILHLFMGWTMIGPN